MNLFIDYLFSAFHLLFLFAFPGIILKPYIKDLNKTSKITFVIFISIAFWICISGFISFFNLPLNYSALTILILFIIYFISKEICHSNPKIYRTFKIKLHSDNIHYYLLLSIILILVIPIFFITIPPGCDTEMHGYITRLVINNNGIPNSYNPILPVNYFGSYSAGFHVITALISAVNLQYLQPSINILSIIVYPLTLLSFIFFLNCFFLEKTSIYVGIIFFGINRTWIDTISWGGNPYLLAFSFCMFSGGLIILTSKCESKSLFYVQAFAIASIPLIHAIAAVTFLYLMIPGIIFMLYYQSENYKVLLSKFSFLFLLVLFLLFPFILKFKSENSNELLIMIKNWQNEMMGKRLSLNLINNILVILDEIKYRIGDVLTILTAISFVIILGFKEYKKATLLIILIVFISLLVLNSAYWILPLSELLYPERVIYFMVIIWSLLTGYFLTNTKSKSLAITFFRKKINLYFIFVIVFTTISILEITKNSIHVSTDKQINCNKNTRKGFQWIIDNTEKKSLIVASYGDNGMWIPTFTNRATLGTHLHFIHLVAHIPDTLNALKVERYYFITKCDISMNTDIFKKAQLLKKIFSNDEVSIYK